MALFLVFFNNLELFLSNYLELFLSIFLAIVVYIVALFVTRAIDDEDITIIKQIRG